MKRRLSKSGMTLVELVVVIGLLGILFTAIYMFFVKGTEQFHFIRQQNQLCTSGKLALEMLSDHIIWAGYMPRGGWSEDEWRPIELGSSGSFHFYADFEGDKFLDDSDHRKIFCDAYGVVHITDDAHMDRIAGNDIVSLQFNYLDGNADILAKPLSESDRKAVRHVMIKITLANTYMGDVYQTVLQTMVTPRNLGVYHNFDPLFYIPTPPEAKIVVNVDANGITGDHEPTVHQLALLNQLDNWGFTIVALSDDELVSFDYDSSGIDIVFLREMIGSHRSVPGLADVLRAVPVPIIVLDPDDAREVFFMGESPHNISGGFGEVIKYESDHPIHRHIVSNPFRIYNTLSGTTITTLDSLYSAPLPAGTELITGCLPDTVSGVSVINQGSAVDPMRVHYCAPDFASYSSDGVMFLYNVILWNLPVAYSPPLGDNINVEGFEGEYPGDIPMTLWKDDLEEGLLLPDSIPLYTDFGSGVNNMIWTYLSTPPGEINLLPDFSLEMHRTATGGWSRNIARAIVDLSQYSALSDELYITAETWKGSSEAINDEDGIFLSSYTTSPVVELVLETFNISLSGNGDVEFWEDTNGRHRVHAPGWNNTTAFATLDSRIDGAFPSTRSRMMIEVDVSGLPDGAVISVDYRMTDHGDESHSYNSSDNRGDYIGWSLGKAIDDNIEDYVNLIPGSKENGNWSNYSYRFIPSGAMPSTVYVVFSQYDNYSATSATGTDGISFDDIHIYADTSTVEMKRIATPTIADGWQRIAVDLDDAALFHAVPFSSNFGIALSQYGIGSWATYGMHWKNFELGVIKETLVIPGWEHRSVVTGEIDDWILENIAGNWKWTLHANNPSNYSNSSSCWLSTPPIVVPDGTVDPIFSFAHSVDFENGYDYGWIEISTDGGITWSVVETSSYNGNFGGHGAYNGLMTASNVDIALDDYTGQTALIRFVFESDGSITAGGWTLDDFEVTGTVSGILIKSIGFKPSNSGGSWYFDDVDVYLGNTTETSFPGNGELDKSTLTYLGSYDLGASTSEWAVINLNEFYILPSATNLLVKIEMNQISPTPGYTWVTAVHQYMTRREISFSGDPSLLNISDLRPALVIGTENYGNRFVDGDSTDISQFVPLAFNALYGDFEGLYLMTDLGFSGESKWIAGGLNNDWEIGVPLFTPDIDPALVPRNENRIAGTDLTVDGFYTPDAEWNWLRSNAYEMAETASYDSVSVSYDRCLRRALNDLAFVQIAFATSTEPPENNSDWITVKTCNYNDDIWQNDVIQLTSYFAEARITGKTHYFIRFVLSAGPYAEKGGWNIDNVGFYGRAK